MFLFGRDYSRKVRELVSRPNSVDIAVAFLGADAKGILANSSGRVICNLESGATNPSAVRALRENPSLEVKTLSTLHAKVILSGGSVLCGSANISANGLGLESDEIAHWDEAGIFSESPSEVDTASVWFRDLWKKALSITDKDLDHADLRWLARRSARPSGAKLGSKPGLFSYLLTNPEFALDRPIYAAVYSETASEEADKACESWKENEGASFSGDVDFYEDWHDLPNNAYLVDIYLGPRGAIRSLGLYWTSPNIITKEFKKNGASVGEIRIVFKVEDYCDLPVKGTELKSFIKFIAPAIRAKWTAVGDPACWFRLDDVLAFRHKAEDSA